MTEAYICAALRTPIGRYGGALSSVRADDLAALPIKALMEQNTKVDWSQVDDVMLGNVNQAGEDNRNVARMALLLAGLPETVTGTTINRLCASGMDAVLTAARAIKAGEMDLIIAGGVESMSRSPFVMGKATTAFSRQAEIFDTTIGWRFINPKMHEMYGTDSMPETAENVAVDFKINREDQDAFAFRSQKKVAASRERLEQEIIPVEIKTRKETIVVSQDEHPRDVSLDKLATLKPVVRPDGSVTAGNASGVNDGSCALLIASEAAMKKHNLTPMARIVMGAPGGVAPRVMGYGPVPAMQKVLQKTNLTIDQMDIIELNEAFASQALAVTRAFNLDDNDPRVNPNGGAIALGHPLGMSGARLVTTAAYELQNSGKQRALCSMCIGVGQGLAIIIERP
ncbi:MAG: 3-oxoadipyl-CoA thiolase [Methylocystaceae bacterium]|nr:3-oxoadipyl-CoA thiolase [Methylocystaceae bacterium]